jgi:hypothetical protein
MQSPLREPLVHFLLGGAALFALHGLVTGPEGGRPERIVVGEERVETLAAAFERPPSGAELQGLVDEFVTEEVLYREALALGLDRDDLVVRRRMRQKMELLNDGLAETEPGDAELSAFLEANAERFRVPPRVSFAQVFASAERAAPRCARTPCSRACAPERTPTASATPRSCPASSPGRHPRRSPAASARPSRRPWPGPRRAPGAGRWSRASACTWCA